MATALAKPTTITVSERTRRLLEAVKGEGESFDDLLQDLVEEASYDDDFYKESQRRWSNAKRVGATKVFKRAGLS